MFIPSQICGRSASEEDRTFSLNATEVEVCVLSKSL